MPIPSVSVIIPIYNVERYIERCARSLFGQTLKDIEYVFVNDCTPDASMDILMNILKEFPERKEQVIVINHPRNLGAAAAREHGIAAATGEYIIHCDSDDWIDLDMYRAMYDKAKAEDLDMVTCDWIETDCKTEVVTTQSLPCSNKAEMLRGLFNRSISGSLWNKLTACYIYKAKIEFSPKSHMMEDVLYSLQLVYNCKRIGHIPTPYYYYYSNLDSVCKKPDEESCVRRCRQAEVNINDIIRYAEAKGIAKQYANEIVVLKNSARVFLWPPLLEHPLKYHKVWRKVYPEINLKYPFTPTIPPTLRIIFVLMLIGIYPFVRKIIN